MPNIWRLTRWSAVISTVRIVLFAQPAITRIALPWNQGRHRWSPPVASRVLSSPGGQSEDTGISLFVRTVESGNRRCSMRAAHREMSSCFPSDAARPLPGPAHVVVRGPGAGNRVAPGTDPDLAAPSRRRDTPLRCLVIADVTAHDGIPGRARAAAVAAGAANAATR